MGTLTGVATLARFFIVRYVPDSELLIIESPVCRAAADALSVPFNGRVIGRWEKDNRSLSRFRERTAACTNKGAQGEK